MKNKSVDYRNSIFILKYPVSITDDLPERDQALTSSRAAPMHGDQNCENT